MKILQELLPMQHVKDKQKQTEEKIKHATSDRHTILRLSQHLHKFPSFRSQFSGKNNLSSSEFYSFTWILPELSYSISLFAQFPMCMLLIQTLTRGRNNLIHFSGEIEEKSYFQVKEKYYIRNQKCIFRVLRLSFRCLDNNKKINFCL